jgi:uncharacterized RDD family membrane protein YckC
MDNAYYILEDGEQKGPFTFDELIDMGPDIHTRVLSPLADTWQDACDLPEFFQYFEAHGIHFPTEDNLASFWIRLLAFIIDLVLLSFVMDIILVILISKGIMPNIQSFDSYSKMPYSKILILQLVFYSTLIIYNSICEASAMQGSIGKKVCKLAVVDADGAGLTYLNAFVRSLGKIVSLFFYGAGFLSIFWSEHRQAMHDYLAKTYVVKL